MEVFDGSTIDIAEGSCELAVVGSQVERQCLAVTEERAAELMVACAHHRSDGTGAPRAASSLPSSECIWFFFSYIKKF